MMDIFGFFRQPDVNCGVEAYHSTPDAVLLDVRSAQATDRLQRMGYQNVQNIGGIAAWKGDVER